MCELNLGVSLITTLVYVMVIVAHLYMKEGSLFCFVVMKSIKPGCFRLCSWSLWKALKEGRGALAWLHDVWTCAIVFEY
jgi:hypothetical protein